MFVVHIAYACVCAFTIFISKKSSSKIKTKIFALKYRSDILNYFRKMMNENLLIVYEWMLRMISISCQNPLWSSKKKKYYNNNIIWPLTKYKHTHAYFVCVMLFNFCNEIFILPNGIIYKEKTGEKHWYNFFFF